MGYSPSQDIFTDPFGRAVNHDINGNWAAEDFLIYWLDQNKLIGWLQKILWSLWQVRSHTERQESSSPTESILGKSAVLFASKFITSDGSSDL